jgi:hypothetical protein
MHVQPINGYRGFSERFPRIDGNDERFACALTNI